MAAPMSRICKQLQYLTNFSSRRINRGQKWCALHFQHKRYCATRALEGQTVRIGCASGFWGDTAVSAPQLIHGGNLDFLVFDYLSEITMSLLTAGKQKMPEMGYAPDFVQVAVAPFIKDIKNKGIRVISNAGGVNPLSCAKALDDAAKAAGIDLKIAVVTGDDLLPQKTDIAQANIVDMDSGMAFPKAVHSMNAYLGAGPIARALDLGADIVITGRCVDSALALAPLIHTFQWQPEQFDKLAAGSLAGHLIECGAQVTGGIFTDWQKVPDWDNIGFPIAECSENGEFIITKPPNTGGIVTVPTTSEQLTYEIGDPKNYVLPDVTCDFADVRLREVEGEDNVVHVSGVKGKPPSDKYKVSATYADGFRITAVCCVVGPLSVEKGQKTADSILKRTKRIFKQLGIEDYTKTHVQIFGSEQSYAEKVRNPALLNEEGGHILRESVIWLAAHHKQKKALEVLAREIAPAGTGMAPGLTGIVGGRPRVSPVLKLFSFLHPKNDVKIDLYMNGSHVESYSPPKETTTYASSDRQSHFEEEEKYDDDAGLKFIKHKDEHVMKFRLEELAYTRSGDKGNSVNIGVIARDPRFAPYLRQALTPEAIDKYFGHLFEDRSGSVSDRIQRYELPGIHSLNFVLKNALGGGGIASLRSDPQGKGVGQMLLDFQVKGVPYLLYREVKASEKKE